MRSFGAISLVAICASCTVVGPDYSQPEINLPTQFAFVKSEALFDAATDRWWERFEDPVLNDLMGRGLVQNLDIKIAQERIRQAQAVYRGQGGAEQINGELSASAIRLSESADAETIRDELSIGATYVFDLFGGFSRAREAARAELEETIDTAAVVRLAYQAELISAYIEARSSQATLANIQVGIGNRQRTLGLITQQLEANDVTRIQSVRARAELADLYADLPARKLGFEQSAVRIAALLGEPTGQITTQLSRNVMPIPSVRDSSPVGIPADLLRNRPDIRAAERNLASDMAAVGVREAALYPSLSLGGSIQVGGDNRLSIGPSLAIPVLSRGRLLADRDAAVSRARQSEIAWQIAVRDAISEVEQNLSRLQIRRSEISALTVALSDYRELRELSTETYGFGATTLLELLDAEQNETDTANDLLLAQRAYAIALAELAVSVGRGAAVSISQEESLRFSAPLTAPRGRKSLADFFK